MDDHPWDPWALNIGRESCNTLAWPPLLGIQVVFQSPGVKIATILEDPIVEASQLHVYATRTKQINIKGRGFFSVYDPQFSPKVKLGRAGLCMPCIGFFSSVVCFLPFEVRVMVMVMA